MYTLCNDTSMRSFASTATNIINQTILIKLQVFNLVKSDIIVNCFLSNNTSNTDDYDIHDVCGTRDDGQFENSLSIHCDHELLCNDNTLRKTDLDEFDTIFSDCHISQWKLKKHIVIIIAMIFFTIVI